ncbi:MAG: DUF1640 domain-containing protein [Magnetococcales bacterium]|nr:DUF1640 domain-containing protein [Magnetococcales bacterium]
MSSITFDTLAFAEELKAAGVSEEQAKAQSRALHKVLEAKDLATKQDLKELELEFKAEFSEVRGELKLIKWMLVLVIAVTVIPILKSLLN